MKTTNRTVGITIKVTEKEKADIVKFAEGHHENISSFIRKSCYKNKPKNDEE